MEIEYIRENVQLNEHGLSHVREQPSVIENTLETNFLSIGS